MWHWSFQLQIIDIVHEGIFRIYGSLFVACMYARVYNWSLDNERYK